MCDVDAWFEVQIFDAESLRASNGCSLEKIEYGEEITEAFCNDIEKGVYPKERN